MTIRKIINLILAVAAFGSFAMAQSGTNQPQGGARRAEQGSGASRRGFGGDSGGGDYGMMGRGRMDFNRLNLTDAQKQQIQTLLENNRRAFDANRAQFEEMGNLMRLKREGLLTTEQGTRLTALQAQMKTNMDRMRSDLSAILTPDQRTLLEQMQRGGGGRGGDGMRDGGGDLMRPGRGGAGGGQRPGGGMPQQSPNDNN